MINVNDKHGEKDQIAKEFTEFEIVTDINNKQLNNNSAILKSY
jgi:hypothetical protein